MLIKYLGGQGANGRIGKKWKPHFAYIQVAKRSIGHGAYEFLLIRVSSLIWWSLGELLIVVVMYGLLNTEAITKVIMPSLILWFGSLIVLLPLLVCIVEFTFFKWQKEK